MSRFNACPEDLQFVSAPLFGSKLLMEGAGTFGNQDIEQCSLALSTTNICGIPVGQGSQVTRLIQRTSNERKTPRVSRKRNPGHGTICRSFIG